MYKVVRREANRKTPPKSNNLIILVTLDIDGDDGDDNDDNGSDSLW